MAYRYFVAGTDTGVGKTLVTAALLHKATQQGYAAFGLKPVAAGCTGFPLQNTDAQLLQRHSATNLSYNTHNPVALEAAIAPHIAATLENKTAEMDLKYLTNACENSLSRALTTANGKLPWHVVEGAGGWLVPLNDQHTLADLAHALRTPVILVVGLRLGCINHAMLSVESIQLSGLPLAGWVANSLEPCMHSEKNNLEYLTQAMQRKNIPLLGKLPYTPSLKESDHARENTLPSAKDIAQMADFIQLPV